MEKYEFCFNFDVSSHQMDCYDGFLNSLYSLCPQYYELPLVFNIQIILITLFDYTYLMHWCQLMDD